MPVNSRTQQHYLDLLKVMREASVSRFAAKEYAHGWLLSSMPPMLYRVVTGMVPNEPRLIHRIMAWLPKRLVFTLMTWSGLIFLLFTERRHWLGPHLPAEKVPQGSVVWLTYFERLRKTVDEPLIDALRGQGLDVVELPKLNSTKWPWRNWIFQLPREIERAVDDVVGLVKVSGSPEVPIVDHGFMCQHFLLQRRFITCLWFLVILVPFVREIAALQDRFALVSRGAGLPIGSLLHGLRRSDCAHNLCSILVPHSTHNVDFHFSDADYFVDVFLARDEAQRDHVRQSHYALRPKLVMFGNPAWEFLSLKRQREAARSVIYILINKACVSDCSARELEALSQILEVGSDFRLTLIKGKKPDRPHALFTMTAKVGFRKAWRLLGASRGFGVERMLDDIGLGIVVSGDNNFVSNVFFDLERFDVPRLIYMQNALGVPSNIKAEMMGHCVSSIGALKNGILKVTSESAGTDPPGAETPISGYEHEEIPVGGPGEKLANVCREMLATEKSL